MHVTKKWLNLYPMTNIEIVQMLANGYTVAEIAQENNVSKYVVAKKIYALRKRCNCETVAQLCVVYLQKRLIECNINC